MSKDFRIIAPITKCYVRRADDGTEKYVVEGLASTTDLDLTGERMAETAITSMAKSIESHPIYLNSEHRPDWDSDFGQVVKLTETPDHQLFMEAELDPDHYRTKTLVKGLDKGKQLGLSIEGEVVEYGFDWMDDVKRAVKTYKNVLLKKISVTGTPAVPETWLNAIAKSVDWSDAPMTKSIEQTKTTETHEEPATTTTEPTETKVEPTVEPQVETKVETPEVTTTATVQEPVTPTVSTTTFDTTTAEGQPEVAKTDETAVIIAADQKEEEPVSEPAPDQATEDTTAKSQYLGEYAEASASMDVLDNLSDSLSWQVFGVIADDTMDAATQISTVEAMLTEFHAIALKVATALIESDAASDAAEAAKSAKSRLDKTEEHQTEELTKSLSDKDTELQAIQKSLETATKERDEAVEKAQTLEEKEATVRKRQNVLLFSKFNDIEKTDDQPAEEGSTLKAWMGSTVNGTKYVTD